MSDNDKVDRLGLPTLACFHTTNVSWHVNNVSLYKGKKKREEERIQIKEKEKKNLMG